jgi:hypothetical protein
MSWSLQQEKTSFSSSVSTEYLWKHIRICVRTDAHAIMAVWISGYNLRYRFRCLNYSWWWIMIDNEVGYAVRWEILWITS